MQQRDPRQGQKLPSSSQAFSDKYGPAMQATIAVGFQTGLPGTSGENSASRAPASAAPAVTPRGRSPAGTPRGGSPAVTPQGLSRTPSPLQAAAKKAALLEVVSRLSARDCILDPKSTYLPQADSAMHAVIAEKTAVGKGGTYSDHNGVIIKWMANNNSNKCVINLRKRLTNNWEGLAGPQGNSLLVLRLKSQNNPDHRGIFATSYYFEMRNPDGSYTKLPLGEAVS